MTGKITSQNLRKYFLYVLFGTLVPVSLLTFGSIFSKPGYEVKRQPLSVAEINQFLPEGEKIDSNDVNGSYKIDLKKFETFLSSKNRYESGSNLEYLVQQAKDTINQSEYNEAFSQALITPEEGGELNAGNLKVSFSVGAVLEPLIVTAILNKEISLGGARVYSFEAKNLYGDEVTNFEKQLVISYRYSSDEVVKASDIRAYYYDTNKSSWANIESKVEGDTVLAYTNHFSTYGFIPIGSDELLSKPPISQVIGEYNYSSCGLIVDDSDITSAERFNCYKIGGVWVPQNVGYKGTALYTSARTISSAYYIPDYKKLNGEYEVFVTIPEPVVPIAFQKSDQLHTNVHYYVLTGKGIEEVFVWVNQKAQAGNIVSLGKFTFDGTDAGVHLWGYELGSDLFIQFYVSDAVCFGSCDDGSGSLDISAPKIEQVKSVQAETEFIVEVKITDIGSGVKNAFLFAGGQVAAMSTNGGDIYSGKVTVPAGASLDYYIVAYDNAGNQSVWSPTRGYLSRSAAMGLGIPESMKCFLNYKNTVLGKTTAPDPGLKPCNAFAGDPVNTSNGNLMEQIGLMDIGGRPKMDFKLTYNSLGGGLGIFGENWNHSYAYKLIYMNNASFNGAVVYYPDGNSVVFKGDNLSATGSSDKLFRDGAGFVLVKHDLTTIKFDSFGDVSRIQDENNNGLNFSYLSHSEFNLSQINRIQADGGRTLDFEYNDFGLVSRITAQEGKIIELGYSNDDLVSIIDPMQGEIKFEYTDHLITKKISPEGHAYYTNTYDNQRRVTRQVAGDDFAQDYTYTSDATGKTTTVKDAKNTTATYRFNNEGLMISNTDEVGNTTQFEFNDKKQLTAQVTPEGQRYEYKYDENWNQIYEKDALGSETFRTFNALNKLTEEIKKEASHKTTYEYDLHGNLTKITNAIGNTSTLEYDNLGQLVLVTDFNGNKTHYSYNQYGDLSSVKNANGSDQEFTYDSIGRLVQKRDWKSNKYIYTYDKNDNIIEIQGPLGFVNKFAYDKNNRLVSKTDATGDVTKYEYDVSENLVAVIDPIGNRTTIEYGVMNEKLKEIDPKGVVTKYAYTSNYNIASITLAEGTSSSSEVKYEYNKNDITVGVIDPLGRVTGYTYDLNNNLIKEVKDKNGLLAETIAEYSPNGIPLKITDANGNVTKYSLDALDRVVSTQDALGNTIEYAYDANGNVIRQTDKKGSVTKFEYDKLNRLKKVTNPVGGTDEYEYDANGNLIMSKNPNNIYTAYYYDELNRLIEKRESFVDLATSLGLSVLNPVQNIFAGHASYNPTLEGIATNVVNKFEYDLDGNIIKSTDARGNPTQFEYDPLNRNTKIIDAKGNYVLINYDAAGNMVSIIDRNNAQTSYSYDELNRLISKTNAEGFIEKYEYDKVGNIISSIDPRNNQTKYSYNGINQLVGVVDALGGTTKYSYDKLNNILSLVDANSHTSTFSYDALNRVISKVDPEGYSEKFTYDANNNLTEKLDKLGNPAKYTYDALNRLVGTIDALNAQTTYAYDSMENIIESTDANSNKTSYLLDQMNRVVRITDAEGKTTSFEYDANGNVAKVIDGNNNPTEYLYDELNRKIKEINAKGAQTSYEYDNEDNVVALIEADNVTTKYNFDKIYRLTSVLQDSSVKTSYSYDANNNLTSIIDPNGNTTSFDYDPLNRQVQETNAIGNTWKYGYDAVGNKISRIDGNGHLTNYAYLADNQLSQIKYFDGSSVSYTYDANNNQISMADSLGTSRFEYDALNRATSITDSLNRTLKYGYDSVGNNTLLQYPDGTSVNYSYAKNNWLNSISTGSESTQYQRDGVGNITRIQNSNNTYSAYAYDSTNQITDIVNVGGGNKINSAFKYTYNNVGLRTQIEEQYNWREPENVTKTYSYDNLRRLTDSTSTGKRNVTNSYTYDNAGNRLSWISNDDQSTPKPFDQTTLSYEYNSLNQLTRIKDLNEKPGNPEKRIKTIEHKNNPRTETRENKKIIPIYNQAFIDGSNGFLKHLTSEYSVGNIKEAAFKDLATQMNNLVVASSNGTLDQATANSALVNITNSINNYAKSKDIKSNGVATSLLNQLDKVKALVGGLPVQLQYSVTTETITIDVPSTIETVEELVYPDPQKFISFEYDKNGNRITKETHGSTKGDDELVKYSYDAEDRLNQVQNFNKLNGKFETKDVTTMSYDGMGRRLVKDSTQGPVHTEYVYNGLDVIAEYTPKNSKNINYYRGEGNRIINSVLKTEDGSVDKFWYHYDALDTVVGLTKSDGQSNHNYRYDDFGRIVPENGNFTEPHNTYTYTGQDWDKNMGIYEFYSRAYDPVNGVWLQQDRYRGELLRPQSIHRYGYVSQNPINRRDYYGYDYSIFSPYISVGEMNANAREFGEDFRMTDAQLERYYVEKMLNDDLYTRYKVMSSMWDLICNEGDAGRLYDYDRILNSLDIEILGLYSKYSWLTGQMSLEYNQAIQGFYSFSGIPIIGRGVGYAETILGYDMSNRQLTPTERILRFTTSTAEVGLDAIAWYWLFGKAGLVTNLTGAGSEVAAKETNTIGATGKVGENYLKSLGGESQVPFRTTLGRRVIDQLIGGVANESKVGYTSLTSTVRNQVLKDVELLQTGAIRSAVWHFFQSPVTGQVGGSQNLLDFLTINAITYIIH